MCIDKYILRYRKQALNILLEWKDLNKMESGNHVKQIHTDWNKGFIFKKFTEYLKSNAILEKIATPYTYQTHGVIRGVC